jgi:excisionase family DNA binding protein
MDDSLSIERAALLLGMTRRDVLALILDRSLPAHLEGTRLRITVADVLRFLERQLDDQTLRDLVGDEMPW